MYPSSLALSMVQHTGLKTRDIGAMDEICSILPSSKNTFPSACQEKYREIYSPLEGDYSLNVWSVCTSYLHTISLTFFFFWPTCVNQDSGEATIV